VRQYSPDAVSRTDYDRAHKTIDICGLDRETLVEA